MATTDKTNEQAATLPQVKVPAPLREIILDMGGVEAKPGVYTKDNLDDKDMITGRGSIDFNQDPKGICTYHDGENLWDERYTREKVEGFPFLAAYMRRRDLFLENMRRHATGEPELPGIEQFNVAATGQKSVDAVSERKGMGKALEEKIGGGGPAARQGAPSGKHSPAAGKPANKNTPPAVLKPAADVMQKLQAPFKPEEIEWRIGATRDGKGLALPYVTNRAIQNRLDEIFGPFGWRNEFQAWKDKGQLCGISIQSPDGSWVTKWDGADDSNMEAIKGGLSDAMKRAAYQWGIGRYLYDVPSVWVKIDSGKKMQETPKLPGWALPQEASK